MSPKVLKGVFGAVGRWWHSHEEGPCGKSLSHWTWVFEGNCGNLTSSFFFLVFWLLKWAIYSNMSSPHVSSLYYPHRGTAHKDQPILDWKLSNLSLMLSEVFYYKKGKLTTNAGIDKRSSITWNRGGKVWDKKFIKRFNGYTWLELTVQTVYT